MILFVDLIAVGIILEQGDATVKILHLDDLVLGIVPVIHLAAVRVALAGLVTHGVPAILHGAALMIGDGGNTIQQVHGDGGGSVPVIHLDQVASAVIQVVGHLTISIPNLADQVDGAVIVFGHITVFISLGNQVAIAVIDEDLAVALGVDFCGHEAAMIISNVGVDESYHGELCLIGYLFD